ncbi:nucleoside-diphosphate-sugar epimerase [Paraburkholderia sp. MM5496-R1]|uniref:SDR family oxidoreductase n=1 Tax=Paraburkholderia sp. MM5496-R1 TaxID=2991065 RepID=UPI003D2218C3
MSASSDSSRHRYGAGLKADSMQGVFRMTAEELEAGQSGHLPERSTSGAVSQRTHETQGDPEVTSPSTARRMAVIAGAGGVVGASLARTLVRKGWEVVGLARSRVDIPGVRWLGVDLTDAQDCQAKLASLNEATHLFCAARYNFAEGGREPLEENLAIVRNVVDTLDDAAPGLRHIHMVQGMKYYGSHTGPFMTPAKENHPRGAVPNFYYLQQDYVSEKQIGARWTWSVSRPDALLHAVPGIPRSLVSVIAVYALICRELGQPLSFPGTTEAYHAIYECTSADHLAEGLLWMCEAPTAANQAFNLINGDYIRWANLWPVFARYFDMPLGPVRTTTLADVMADKGRVWDAIVQRAGLTSMPYDRVALWTYADYIWSRGWDVMADMTKIRLHGFHRVVDTEAEFIRFFDELRAQRIIP